MVDIEYARRLSENNIVLWWSPNPLPDLGGFEMDRMIDFDSLAFPTINNPEIYETACLEVEIGTLTINTILTSALINEAEEQIWQMKICILITTMVLPLC